MVRWWPFADDDEAWTLLLGAGVLPPRTNGCCCAAPDPDAAARCRESAGTTRQWRSWRCLTVADRRSTVPVARADRSARGDVEVMASTVITAPSAALTHHIGPCRRREPGAGRVQGGRGDQAALGDTDAHAHPGGWSRSPPRAARRGHWHPADRGVGDRGVDQCRTMPNTAKMPRIAQTGVPAVRKVSSTDAAVINPAASSDGRGPNRPTIRPDGGENTRAPMASEGTAGRCRRPSNRARPAGRATS